MSVGLTPRGQPMPQTVEEWRYLANLYETKMLEDKQIISDLKNKIDSLQRRLQKREYHVQD